MALHPDFPLSPYAPLLPEQKMARLKQWCADATAAEENAPRYAFVCVDQNGFEKHAPKIFAALAANFTEYKP